MNESLNRPDLSVIVVTHNRPDLAVQTIRSGRAATGNISVDWHVVDSGSTDPVADVIEREWPDIDVRRADNVGFAAANNDALQRARGRYVLLLNPDIEIVGGTLEQLVATLDARPEVGMASVIQRGPDGSLDYSIRRDPNPVRMLAEALAPAVWPSSSASARSRRAGPGMRRRPRRTGSAAPSSSPARKRCATWEGSMSASSCTPRRPTGATAAGRRAGTCAIFP